MNSSCLKIVVYCVIVIILFKCIEFFNSDNRLNVAVSFYLFKCSCLILVV